MDIMSVKTMQRLTQDAIRTEPIYDRAMVERLSDPHMLRMLHAAMGMVTEAGEFLDALKKHIYYGKPLDRVHLIEEIGDQTWYQRIGADELQMSFLEIMELNVAKLRTRYPARFSQTAALNRDLNAERNTLERGE